MKVLRYEKNYKQRNQKQNTTWKYSLHTVQVQVYSEAVIMEETENTETSY